MPTTFNVIYVGTYADIDPFEHAGPPGPYPFESRDLADDADILVGETFGSAGDPLATDASDFVAFTKVSTSDMDNVQPGDQLGYNQTNPHSDGSTETGGDTFQIDGGAIQTFDSIVIYNATITYVGGSTDTVTLVVFQDIDGKTYIAPESTQNADQEALERGPIQSITIDSVAEDNLAGMSEDRAAWDLSSICFARGSMIVTIKGERLIEELAVGDRVLTMDNGYQRIRWIGSRKFDSIDLTVSPKLRPIRIESGALGVNLPYQDLLVSPQHRILVRSKIAKRMFDTSEVLIPANKLIDLNGVGLADDLGKVEYYHILFDDHQIIYSNGMPTESLFTGPEALKAVSPKARSEIETIFPDICAPDFVPIPVRHIPESGKYMKRLVARHKKNGKLLYSIT